ncbi:vacuolar protein sorting-associated protein 9 [Pyrenophora tritici-repentis Pt-1C-BFP]|uniref:Vacuolar protein sorting-associated protein 9 n=2 Tax=Pyrenophora tritici-repentis TaxID=45151 RepID=B2VX98_PYRTR|nr:vacuolar protein sorting-associated protein 9 [Pyrenophora tritici-repentis Pt-1C-BFP]EDU45667.1 vacuolar protein sorting-associated protein 9 [Pyrenophora tritici-repentis Pt-1C-BFP]
MSPPNATPQHNAADDVTREKQLDHVAEKKHVDITAEKEPIAAPDVEPKADADDANTTAEEGRPLEAQAGVRDVEHEVNEERAVPHDMKAATEEAHDSAQQLDATANSTEREEVAKLPSAELVEQLTTATENLALGRSTPPPEPSEKAAGKAPMQSPSPPPPPPKDDKYLTASNVPSRATSPMSQGRSSGRNSEDGAAEEYTANNNDGTGDAVDNSQSEIQNIIDQFQDNEGPGEEEIMSPRLELASPMLDSPTTPYPPRRSSLVPVDKPLPTPTDDTAPKSPLQSPPPRTSSLRRVGTDTSFAEPTSPSAHASKYKPAQPVPEPEPDLPFDFHRFLEQLRHRTADPVAKFLRSFLLEFGKKQWMVHEQVKIIGDFLEFISKKMAQCEVWRTVSDAEFDNAREGMEKLVMNRLYNQTFSPAIPPPEPLSPRKGRRRQDPVGPGRRGQHQEDVERDEVLAQKVRIYKWVSEEHLDIKPVGEKGKKFLHLAQQELLKIKSYRAPRDKIICILNCCKVIFGFLRTSSSDQSADAFVPLLIYTVLQANPDHLVSNVQYILRFRNQDKLGGEAGYYISSLMGAVQFIEGLDKTSLTVTDEEFERNVEAAVSAIAERHAAEEAEEAESSNSTLLNPTNPTHKRVPSPHYHHLSEKTTPLRPELTQRNSMEAETAGPRRSTSLKEKNRTDDDNQEQRQQQPEEENAAVAGLLRTIQRPLSTIGRIFSDTDTHPASAPTTSSSTPKPTSASALSPSSDMFPGQPSEKEKNRRSHEDASDAAARQASVEAEEARRIQRKEHRVVVETLTGMFPQLDRDVIDDVVREKEGRVGLAVDACLALANP